jgi:hypothetical protein
MKQLIVRQLFEPRATGIPMKEQHKFMAYIGSSNWRTIAKPGSWSCYSDNFESFVLIINPNNDKPLDDVRAVEIPF